MTLVKTDMHVMHAPRTVENCRKEGGGDYNGCRIFGSLAPHNR